MDPTHFDRFVRSFATADTRRSLLRLLTALPIAGAFASVGLSESEAGRRKRRQHRHDPGKKRDRHQRRRKNKHKPNPPNPPNREAPAACIPESAAQTCAGKCGAVPNNCGNPVDCGSCVCDPPCPVCQSCNAGTGQCEPDGALREQPCGSFGQVCQSDGSCACSGSSCGPCRTCQGDGTCSAICNGAGCCDGTTCQDGTSDGACGTGGETCSPCSGTGVTCGGGDTPGRCGCKPVADSAACGSQTCGTTVNNCGQTVQCSGCTGCCDGNTCHTEQSTSACGTGGTSCVTCSGTGVTCGGGGTPGKCGCTPTTCDAQHQICGTLPDGCGAVLTCTGCSGCCDGNDCVPVNAQTNAQCGTGVPGAGCVTCSGTGVTCGGGDTPGRCGCSPQSDTVTCVGKCGTVQNNCGVDVDCTALCAGCCDGGTCVAVGDQTDGRCGTGVPGAACVTCSGTGVSCGGGGTPGRCGCTPNPDLTTCTGKCGTVQNNCGQSVNCTALCAGCCNGNTCVSTGAQNATRCGTNGAPCQSCPAAGPPPANTVPTCASGTCTYPCNTGAGAITCGPVCCAAGQQCTNAATGTCCTPSCTNRECGSDTCGGVCPPGCGANETCVEASGTCCTDLLATCSGSGQSSCCQSGGSTVCEAYAQCGSVSAGQRCCRLPGGACRGDCDCCGNATCLNGSCTGCTADNQCSSNVCCGHICCAQGQTCQNGECTSPPDVCKPKLEVCSVDATHPAPAGTCCQTNGALACQTYGACGQIPGGSTRCCVPDGGTCSQLCDCCGSSRCFNGVCHPSAGQYPDSRCPTGTTLLGTCSTSSECCQYGEASGSVVCAAYGTGCSVSPGQRCCRPAGKPCTDSCDCCGVLRCISGTCG